MLAPLQTAHSHLVYRGEAHKQWEVHVAVEVDRRRASPTKSRNCRRSRTRYNRIMPEERAFPADLRSLDGVEAHRVEEHYNRSRRAVCLKRITKLSKAQAAEEVP